MTQVVAEILILTGTGIVRRVVWQMLTHFRGSGCLHHKVDDPGDINLHTIQKTKETLSHASKHVKEKKT